jgi:transglutaminase-like putative cysteine protease
MKLRSLFFVLLAINLLPAFSQDPSKIKFGKITPADFEPKLYGIDSSASAVVLADIGSTEIVGNQKGSFSLVFKNFRRARILNKNGYDLADVTIPIYDDGKMEEELASLKAVTYNLENGKVVETKLDVKAAVFKDRINKRLSIKKFTFPNIKEGSIIEYEYRLNSDFIFNLQPWTFQGAYPRLWSEYNVSMPEFYYYVTLAQGYQPFFIKDRKERRDNFTITDNSSIQTSRESFSCSVADYRWAMKDVPALKEESFTSTIDNHVAKLEFQLAELRYPFTPRNIMGTWTNATETMLKDEDFGLQLSKDNGWLNDVMGEATGGSKDALAKAQNIFSYLRDNMTCTDYNRRYADKNLRTVLKSRNGSEAEINLLLTAMLKKADLDAEPVLLSTRSHGYTYAMYPLMDRFNYVISKLNIDGKEYFLDASKPRMGFGRLGYECYNGHARVVNADATPVELISDSLMESKITSVFIINDEKGDLTGSMQQTPGYFESNSIRNRIKEKGRESFFNEYKKGWTGEVELEKENIDSLNKYDYPLAIRYDFNMKLDKEDILYLNPMFTEGIKENPFKSAQRFYPVEMPYAIDETYLLRLDVPKGYVIDELPKQLMLKLNEQNDGMFEYRISESNGIISMRSRLRISRAYFLPEEYEMLREFFNYVVKKHNEQIVFKKKP